MTHEPIPRNHSLVPTTAPSDPDLFAVWFFTKRLDVLGVISLLHRLIRKGNS